MRHWLNFVSKTRLRIVYHRIGSSWEVIIMSGDEWVLDRQRMLCSIEDWQSILLAGWGSLVSTAVHSDQGNEDTVTLLCPAYMAANDLIGHLPEMPPHSLEYQPTLWLVLKCELLCKPLHAIVAWHYCRCMACNPGICNRKALLVKIQSDTGQQWWAQQISNKSICTKGANLTSLVRRPCLWR